MPDAAANSELPPPMNHVFVDFENVHHIDLSFIGKKTMSFTLLLGAKQTKLDATLIEKLMAHAASVHIVRLASSGKNALDLALSYYLGRAVITDPTAYFHVVSKDTGYDPLIKHLRSRHIHACRHDDYSKLTLSAGPKASTGPSEDLMTRVLERLRKNPANLPKQMKKLKSYLLTFAGKSANEADVSALIEKLCAKGIVRLGERDAVSYHL